MISVDKYSNLLWSVVTYPTKKLKAFTLRAKLEGATTFSIMTLNMVTFRIMTLSIPVKMFFHSTIIEQVSF
jgi:hypothetical protein